MMTMTRALRSGVGRLVLELGNPLRPSSGQPLRQLQRASSSSSSSSSAALGKDDRQQQHKGEGSEETTHFGFKTVPREEKVHLVGQVFSNVASRYDLMNDLMSAGIHRYWKDVFVKETLAPVPGLQLLDVAGGTGDIAFRVLEMIRNSPLHFHKASTPNPGAKRSKVVVCDINPDMLAVGQQRASERGYCNWADPTIEFVQGDAHDLSRFEDESMDAYTIAFGIRNCTDVPQVVREAYRVLKKGGRFLCLEFSRVENPALASVYDAYSFQVIPALGEAVASDRASYQYLVESIRKFPSQEEFKRIIEEAGFREVSYQNLTFGVVAIHSGFKL